MNIITRCWQLGIGIFWESVNRRRQDIPNYLPRVTRHPKPGWSMLLNWKRNWVKHFFFKESAKRSINPTSGTVFNMWTKYVGRFGSANGPHSFVKACEEIEKINFKAGEKIASIKLTLSLFSSIPPHTKLCAKILAVKNFDLSCDPLPPLTFFP